MDDFDTLMLTLFAIVFLCTYWGLILFVDNVNPWIKRRSRARAMREYPGQHRTERTDHAHDGLRTM